MLLTTTAKLNKGNQFYYSGLMLSPGISSGFEVCHDENGLLRGECYLSCLAHSSGHMVMHNARSAARRRTRWLMTDPADFYEQLNADIRQHVARAQSIGLPPLIRLNLGSDLDWLSTIRAHPDCTFCDYTKSVSRMRRYIAREDWPPNYYLTYSISEQSNQSTVASLLDRGANCSLVLNIGRYDRKPDTWTIRRKAYQVIDGDFHDYRLPWIDGSGVIVGLFLKGTNRAKSLARASHFAR